MSKETTCETSPRNSKFLNSCPEEKVADCTPSYSASRRSSTSTGDLIFPNNICFGNTMPTLETAPAGARCWCGNGFQGNNYPYYIWETCMANCQICDLSMCQGGYIRRYAPNCCGIDITYPYNNCIGCSDSGIIPIYNPKMDHACCSYICQPVAGRTTYRNESTFIAEDIVTQKYPSGISSIDIGGSTITKFCCCSKSNKMVYTAPATFSFIASKLPLINFFDRDILLTDLNPEFFGDVTVCNDAITETSELKITFNYGEMNKSCYIKDITRFFTERFDRLPSIKGVSLDIQFPEKQFWLDINPQYNETNNIDVAFDYNNNENTFAKFGLDTINDIPNTSIVCARYDENYQDIPTLGVYGENDGRSFYMYFPASAKLAGSASPPAFGSDKINIEKIIPQIRFQYFNNKIYMSFIVQFRISYDFSYDDVSFISQREIKKVADLYEDFNAESFISSKNLQLKIRGNIYA